jgi:hypothetical protein
LKNKEKKDLRIFAFIWSGIFSIVALFPLSSGENIKIWAIFIAVSFAAVSISNPALLIKFYKIWVKFGEFCGGIISKIIMFILYFGLFTPMSVVLKVSGKDLLNKKINKAKNSHWIKREKQPESMKNQF